MKILMVENHDVFARVVIGQFLADHTVTVVPSIGEAKETLRSTGFDVIMVDYDLDDGKGDELVRCIRSRQKAETIIAMSAHDAGNAALMAAGADRCCPKTEFNQIGQMMEQRCAG